MQLRISLASPEQMRQWSGGEVTRADTIHYRTHLPEPDGLFCQRIFGPVKDWTCACPPSVRAREREPGQRGTCCPRCGVLRGESRLRRERMGHLELAAPVAHPWFAHGSPSVLSLLLGLSQAHLETVLAYAGYLVLPTPEKERHHAPVETADALQQAVGSYLDERTVRDLREQDREQQGFPACLGTGPEAVHTVLAHLDLPALAEEVRAALHDAPDEEQAKRLSKRLQVIEALRHSEIRPEWMILTVLPVLPPDLRPILVMDGNRIASADVNTLYERVLHRNQRIRQFEERGAPTLLLHQEKRALQHSVEALLDNGHSSHPVTNARRQRLKSLTDSLAGKQGRFRLNLLGKRVDYSGRSVIVGNPRLKLHQCGLPKIMACELFKPFIMRKLVDRHLARTLRHAKRLVERRDPVIWDQLAECLYERVVLLNRAPTLHRLSIQAFEPVLIEGSALQLHPQVCSSFNADFDGDQMAVHVPLSDAAQAEARALLLSTHNLRSPANGDPSITISQEQVLGLYYLTEERPSDKRAGRIFVDPNEARLAYEQGIIDLHTPIVVRLADQQSYAAPGEAHPLPARGRLETTVGRLLFNEALPDALRYKNYAMTKDALKQLIAECLTCCGDEVTATLADRLKTLGFSYATQSGISFAMSDIAMPPQRETLIAEGQQRWNEASDLLQSGEITSDEWYRQTITLWTAITDRIADTLKDVLPPFGTMMTIVKSGATKAKFQQIRQLSGIRGLLASPSGRIIPQPVLSNYLLGMLVWEIFIAARAARKGFMDRSLNTAPSGYLTRKLVETGMPLWITMADCGTHEGLLMTAALGRRAGYADLRPLLVGRVLAEPVAHLPEGTLLTKQMVDALLAQGIEQARIRSPLTCQAEVGLCQQCYGCDLATGKLVRRGVAVGVIAGQSIGEPGTQLTMRTFHSGGVANAQGDITQGMPRVSELFEARTPKHKALLARIAGRVKLDEAHPQHMTLVTETTLYDDYPLPPAATILVREQERVDAGQVLAHSTHGAIQSRYAAIVEQVGDGVITLRGEEQEEHSYTLPAGMQWIVPTGQQVEVGAPLSTGAIDPHELLSLCGVEAVARYLVSEVQAVYRTSGASLSDKHPETIVRQMLHCVRVVEEGDTDLIPGAIIPRTRFARETAAVLAQGGRPPVACPVLLGLTQTVLATESWVVAASFQQTARVLTQAALRGQLDPLVGLKENVMVGLPIPTPV